MKVKKLLCLGMAAALMCSNLFQMRISAQELNAVDVVMENTIGEESAGVSNAENGDYEYVELEDGTLEIRRYSGDDTELVIPEKIDGKKVTSIGSYAFSYCGGLANITIPDSVTSIGSGAFKRCERLMSIAIPEGVTSIGDGAFDYCISLMSITIPEGVTSIESWAYRCCMNLTSIKIPDSVTSIESEAFSGCSGLTSITIPDGVTSIGSSAFHDCSGLTSIMISDSVTSIGSYAFNSCNGLTSITIPDSVTSVGSHAFGSCSGLTSITIPASLTSIEDNAFWGCSGLKSIKVESENPKYDSRENCNAIIETESNELICGCKNTIIPADVTSIGSYAFRDCGGLTNITIPEGVTRIGDCAFYDCISLTSITIPDSVTSIEGFAYRGCISLTNITISDSVTSIGSYAFEDCISLTSITIPASIASIGSYAFKGCNGLKNIKVESENPKYDSREDCNAIIETESNELIYGCKNTIIPASVTRIGDCAFYDCISLTSIAIPNSVTSIGSHAFSGCNGLTGITISEGVTRIESYAFRGCEGLTNITIPDSVSMIESEAFEDCISLMSITISEGVRIIQSEAFKNCSGLTNIMISEGVTSIENGVFSGCSRLTSITIPDSVTSIGYYAFEDCISLTSITIPAGVMGIRSSAFSGCSSLVSIKVRGENPKYDSRENCNAIIETESNQLVCGCKNTIIPASVTSIGSGAFGGCSGLTSIEIPDSVTSIGSGAFYNCSNLTSIAIPEGVTSIGSNAFGGYSGLKSIKVERGNPKYDSRENCNALIRTESNHLICGCENTIIPDSVTSIGDSAFKNCSGLTNITIPDSVTSIGSNAFKNCSGLINITIPEGVMSIGSVAFGGCSGLVSIKVEGENPKYDSRENCNAIIEMESNQLVCGCKNTIIPASVTSIGSGAFGGCSGLTSIEIPDSVTSIGSGAFYNCSSLTSIMIPDSVTRIWNEAFSGCSSLTSITIPNNVTSIRSDAFYNCSSLTSITIPDSVTNIESRAFKDCSNLMSITIPDSVTRICDVIYYEAFSGCSNLTIFGKDGSYAKIYAKKTGIPFSVIVGPQNIKNCEITLSAVGYTYDGSEKEPIVTVKDGAIRLVNGKDYSITYSDNINAGTATITITGIGNYTGTTSKTFTISAKSISGTNVTLETTSYTYDGTEKRPSAIVKDGSTTLIEGTDYTLAYSNNINAGTAAVNITGKGNYTGTVSKTFTILAKRGPFLWDQDNWNFNNSSYQGYFSSGKYIDQINDTYLNKLKSNLTNSEYRAVFDSRTGWINNRFGGSCYGMSSTGLLAMEGFLPYSNYKPGATKLYQLSYPVADRNISSLITYYQMLQIKGVIQQQYRTVPYKTNKENIQKIISLLDENNTVLIGFQKTGWGGHAILAYGYEYGSYTWNGVSYQGCIKICDPNSSKEYKKECNIYYNTNTYNWTIPYYSSVPITSISGARFNYVGANVNEINFGGYLSGTSNVNISNYVARIDAAAVSENRSVTKVSEVDGNYLPQNNAPGDIIEDYSYVLGAEFAGTIGYNLYDAESAYKLSQDNAEELQLSMNYEDCYLEGGSAAGNAVIFDKNGYVSVSGESADYNISMTFNDDYPTDWFTIQIDGSGSNEVSLEKSDMGYILSGDSLENVEVSVNNKYDSAHARFSTEFPSAYIYEINGGIIGVKVDADENGTYETLLTTEDTHQYDNEWKTDDNNHWKECKCGEKAELTSHEFEWIIDREETMTESGLKHEECIVCGYNRNENTVIHNHMKVIDKAIAPTCTDTGLTEGEHCSRCGEVLKKQQVVKAFGHNYVNGVCSRCGALKTGIPQKDQKLTDSKTGAVYMVTSVETKGGTVEYVKSLRNGSSNISVPSTVEIDGISYEVTSIAANAFKNNKKLTKVKIGADIVSIGNNAFYQCTSLKTVTIPAKVKNIGKQAFYGCKKLKTIKIKTKKLTSKNVGKKAFAKIHPKATAKAPSSCLISYKKLLQKKGLNGKKQKIKK